MRGGCVAARQVYLQLQPEAQLCHAYFTVPLRHQVHAVSRFPVISLARLVDSPALCLFWAVRVLSCATCGRSYVSTYCPNMSGCSVEDQ